MLGVIHQSLIPKMSYYFTIQYLSKHNSKNKTSNIKKEKMRINVGQLLLL